MYEAKLEQFTLSKIFPEGSIPTKLTRRDLLTQSDPAIDQFLFRVVYFTEIVSQPRFHLPLLATSEPD